MNPATGTFISMDTYQDTLFEPATLHKYLYANANPVMNVDPTGYFTLAELNVSQAINDTLEKWNDSWAIRTYHRLKSKLELINNCLVVYDTIRQATLWLTDPDASAMDVLFGIAGGIISGVFLKRMCDIKNIGPVISKIALLGGYASQVKAIVDAIKNEQWDQVITQTFHLTLSILALSDNCFTGETLVASENGQIRIDEIEVGDKIWAYDIFTGETALKEVLTVYVHDVDEILHLYTSCGDIDTTTNHPFYVIDRGWVAAGDLVEGDEIYLLDGTVAYVTSSELEKLDEPITVYNLEVLDNHTYFVGDKAILVHNECKGNWADGGRGSGEQNSLDHYDKHGGEVGARDYEDYLRKAKAFANTVLSKKIKGRYISGYTDGVYRYNYNGKYIDLVFNGIEHLIVSFGRNGDGWY